MNPVLCIGMKQLWHKEAAPRNPKVAVKMKKREKGLSEVTQASDHKTPIFPVQPIPTQLSDIVIPILFLIERYEFPQVSYRKILVFTKNAKLMRGFNSWKCIGL